MPAEGILCRLAKRASLTDEIIATLKNQIADLKKEVLKKYYEKETSHLKAENAALKVQMEEWRSRLIAAEIRNGIEQVSVPTKNVCSKEESPVDLKNIAPDNTRSSLKEAKEANTKNEKCSKKVKKNKETKVENEKSEPDRPIDVSLLEFRTGYILEAEKHPDADSLYVEKINVGEEKPRTVVSGLVKYVPLEDLRERMVIVLCNLKPVKMRGVLSEAMVMCASSPSKVEVLNPPPGCIPGEKVTFEGYLGIPEKILNPKKQIFEKVAPDLRTNDECVATYKGIPFRVGDKGIVTASSMTNAQIK